MKADACNIRSIVYQADKELLEIRFHSGSSYRYLGVPGNIYEQFLASTAKDEFFARNIKTKYRCKKVLIV